LRERERETPLLALSSLERKMRAETFKPFSQDITTPLMWDDVLTSSHLSFFLKKPLPLSLILTRQENASPTIDSHTDRPSRQRNEPRRKFFSYSQCSFSPSYYPSLPPPPSPPLSSPSSLFSGSGVKSGLSHSPLHLSNDKDKDKARGAGSMAIAKARAG
jgi:hypothetical protein